MLFPQVPKTLDGVFSHGRVDKPQEVTKLKKCKVMTYPALHFQGLVATTSPEQEHEYYSLA